MLYSFCNVSVTGNISCKLFSQPFYRDNEFVAYYKTVRKTLSYNANSANESPCSKETLKHKLTDLQYKVTQEKHTEIPFSGIYVNNFSPGVYHCVVCETDLFSSTSKFVCSAGWPAFSEAMDKQVAYNLDPSAGELRVEVVCKECGAHLGHVFDDGPKPSGLRYCINSAALVYQPSQTGAQE
ncbi:Peptide methionine sulfoxide reductase MsrB [Fasciola hepatica]|uniref:Peptide-methionine (R)-S-oxide reductase n=1 Tax=Fasciola hepatica TaxID=6192 RepID=A0A4E0R3S2_FASHE|nr:Peptide methionine sulfoxide reductase MsrB [Fasciola hepatica]